LQAAGAAYALVSASLAKQELQMRTCVLLHLCAASNFIL
jgi:hypothetical protein